MTDDRPDAVCVVVIHGHGADARLLVIRRARGVFKGAWTYVMGGIEAGERAADAALRELHEETSLRPQGLYLAGAFDVFYDPRRDAIRKVAIFVARVDSREVHLDDAHEAFEWVTFAQADALLEFPSHRRLLPDLQRDFVEREPSSWRVIFSS